MCTPLLPWVQSNKRKFRIHLTKMMDTYVCGPRASCFIIIYNWAIHALQWTFFYRLLGKTQHQKDRVLSHNALYQVGKLIESEDSAVRKEVYEVIEDYAVHRYIYPTLVLHTPLHRYTILTLDTSLHRCKPNIIHITSQVHKPHITHITAHVYKPHITLITAQYM